MAIRVAVASLLLVGVVAAWPAGVRAESEQDREACTPDVHQHCGQFIPDREAIVQCLKQKVKLLSPACRRVMTRPYNPRNS